MVRIWIRQWLGGVMRSEGQTWEMLIKGKLAGCGDELDPSQIHGIGDCEDDVIIPWNRSPREELICLGGVGGRW